MVTGRDSMSLNFVPYAGLSMIHAEHVYLAWTMYADGQGHFNIRCS
jgi:hypothetical protein